MTARFYKFLTVLGLAGCAPAFSSVEEARQYLLQDPTGARAQEAFCIVAAAGESGTLPRFTTASATAPTIEQCAPDGRVLASAGRSGDSASEAY